MLKKIALAAFLFAGITARLAAQSTGIGTITPNSSAQLDVTSTTKGFLPPRMTQAQRDGISGPAAGLTIYNTTTSKINCWNGAAWQEVLGQTLATTTTFNFTGGAQSYTVPAGITSITVQAAGAKGGNNYQNQYSGGYGAVVTATIAVNPGDVLAVYVGGAGIISTSTASYPAGGGYNGGGGGSAYNGSGGGASDIRINGTALSNRILVAGGGGGAVTSHPGGGGGAPNGINGTGIAGVGTGGTLTTGGSLGGTQGQGGDGYYSGGGGGYYGGGGDNGYAGGGSAGGGSSYAISTATNVAMTAATNNGNGYVTITTVPVGPAFDGSQITWASQSQTANGYAKMGGVILQWGTVNYTSSSTVIVSYPIAFSNVFSVTATVNDAGGGSGGNVPCKTTAITNSSFGLGGTAIFSGDASTKVKWIAIGN